MADYDRALEICTKIEALYAEIENHRAWFRGRQLVGANVPRPAGVSPTVEVDRVFCALAIKAATTHRAILTLCEAGNGDSAFILARTTIEASFLMQWMLGGPGRDRLETYTLFTSVLHERTVEMFAKHFRDNPALLAAVSTRSNPYHRAITKVVFGGHDNTWAYFPVEGKPGRLRQVRIADMFREREGDFAYEGPYAEGSQFVHSGPESLVEILSHLSGERHFSLREMPSTKRRGMALSYSNAAMLMVLDALNDLLGCGLGERIMGIAEEWRAYARSSFGEASGAAVAPRRRRLEDLAPAVRRPTVRSRRTQRESD